MTYSNEEFNYTVNLLGHCWECNQPGHVRIKCPDLGQSRMSYRGGQDEDVRCYNCDKYGHCYRDCRLSNRKTKDQEFTEDEFRKICKKVITENLKPRESRLLHNLCSLQHKVNNLSIEKRKTSFAQFKVKQQNIFGLVLIDTRNLVNSAVVLGVFWESIGGKIRSSMDYKEGTADGKSDNLQVLGEGEPWPIYLEGT